MKRTKRLSALFLAFIMVVNMSNTALAASSDLLSDYTAAASTDPADSNGEGSAGTVYIDSSGNTVDIDVESDQERDPADGEENAPAGSDTSTGADKSTEAASVPEKAPQQEEPEEAPELPEESSPAVVAEEDPNEDSGIMATSTTEITGITTSNTADPVTRDFTNTQNGQVYVDKSVKTNGTSGFTETLSVDTGVETVTSTEINEFSDITGDYVIVLDLSMSLYNNADKSYTFISSEVSAVNKLVKEISKNSGSRVAVWAFGGDTGKSNYYGSDNTAKNQNDNAANLILQMRNWSSVSNPLQLDRSGSDPLDWYVHPSTAATSAQGYTDEARRFYLSYGTYMQAGIAGAGYTLSNYYKSASADSGGNKNAHIIIMSDGVPTCGTTSYNSAWGSTVAKANAPFTDPANTTRYGTGGDGEANIYGDSGEGDGCKAAYYTLRTMDYWKSQLKSIGYDTADFHGIFFNTYNTATSSSTLDKEAFQRLGRWVLGLTTNKSYILDSNGNKKLYTSSGWVADRTASYFYNATDSRLKYVQAAASRFSSANKNYAPILGHAADVYGNAAGISTLVDCLMDEMVTTYATSSITSKTIYAANSDVTVTTKTQKYIIADASVAPTVTCSNTVYSPAKTTSSKNTTTYTYNIPIKSVTYNPTVTITTSDNQSTITYTVPKDMANTGAASFAQYNLILCETDPEALYALVKNSSGFDSSTNTFTVYANTWSGSDTTDSTATFTTTSDAAYYKNSQNKAVKKTKSSNPTGTLSYVENTTLKSGAANTVKLGNNGKLTVKFNTVTILDPGSLTVTKICEQTGEKLSGAVFTVYESNGRGGWTSIGTITTGSNGTATKTDLNMTDTNGGKFKVVETTAPSGVANTGWSQEFTMTREGQTFSYTCSDPIPTGAITIKKIDADTGAFSSALAGATFTVTAANTITSKWGTTLVAKGASVGTITIGSTGTGSLSGLYPGTYTITETVVPNGYKAPASSSTVTISYPSSSTATTIAAQTVTISNQKNSGGSVSVTKKDSNGNTLSGVTFQLWKKNSSGTYVTVSTATTNSSGVASFANLSAADAEQYKITELATVTGTNLNSGFYYEFNIKTGAYTYKANSSASATSGTKTISNNMVTFSTECVNEAWDGSLTVTKTCEQTGDKLSGAVFTVYESNGRGGWTSIGTITTGSNGTATKTGLTYTTTNKGKFKVVETTAPTGVANTNWSQEFTLSQDNQVIAYTCSDPIPEGVINVEKTDASTGDPLSGVVFQVAAAENITSKWGTTLISKGTVIGTITTDDKGKGSLISTDAHPIYPGKYTLTETKTLDDYVLLSTPVTVTLDWPAANSTTTTVTTTARVTNTKKGQPSMAVAKLADKTTGATLNSASGRYSGTKTPGTYQDGETVTFTLTVTNTGSTKLFNIDLSDDITQLAGHLKANTFHYTVSQGDTITTTQGAKATVTNIKQSGNVYHLTLNELAAGDSVNITATGTVSSTVMASDLPNEVTLTSQYDSAGNDSENGTLKDTPDTIVDGENYSQDSDAINTTVDLHPAMAVAKLADKTTGAALDADTGRYTGTKTAGTYLRGSTVTYTLTVTNTGDTTLFDVALSDDMSKVAPYLEANTFRYTVSKGSAITTAKGAKATVTNVTQSGNTYTITLDKLAAGDSVAITAAGTVADDVTATMGIPNTVTLTSKYDPTGANDSANELTDTPDTIVDGENYSQDEDAIHVGADLHPAMAVAKLADKTTGATLDADTGRYTGTKTAGTYKQDETVTFTLTATNTGDTSLFGVSLSDDITQLADYIEPGSFHFAVKKGDTIPTTQGAKATVTDIVQSDNTYTVTLDELSPGDSVNVTCAAVIAVSTRADKLTNTVTLTSKYDPTGNEDSANELTDTPDTIVDSENYSQDEDSISLEGRGSITIVKYDTDGTTPLEGVTFTLSNADGEAVEQSTDSKGEVHFDDLALGDYTITETKTLPGHSLLADSIQVTIPLTLTDEEVKAQDADTSNAYHDKETGVWYFYDLTYHITNHSVLDIPSTGGNPTIVWLTGALGLCGLAAVCYLLLRKYRAG